jgi:hypothetical protein
VKLEVPNRRFIKKQRNSRRFSGIQYSSGTLRSSRGCQELSAGNVSMVERPSESAPWRSRAGARGTLLKVIEFAATPPPSHLLVSRVPPSVQPPRAGPDRTGPLPCRQPAVIGYLMTPAYRDATAIAKRRVNLYGQRPLRRAVVAVRVAVTSHLGSRPRDLHSACGILVGPMRAGESPSSRPWTTREAAN